MRQVPTYDIFEFSSKKNKYCVGIPLLNEGDRIKKQLKTMYDLKIHEIADIIIFDGNTIDGSTEHEFLKSMRVNTLLVMTEEGRQGSQFRMGFDFILNRGYKGVISIDGNNKDGVQAIPNFIQKLEGGQDYIQGSRFISGGYHMNTPLARLLAIKLIHAPCINFMARFKYTDTTCGYRGISRLFLEDNKLDIFRNIFVGYELFYYMSVMAPKLGYNTCEIPTSRVYPSKGKAPTKITMRGNFIIIHELWKLQTGFYNSKKG